MEMQLEVRHIKANFTGEIRKQMQDQVEFNTEGPAKTDGLAHMGADMSNANSAELLASELQAVMRAIMKA